MKNKLNKFIIAFDTIFDGWQCTTGENGKPNPTLFDSRDEAMKELFDDALCMLTAQTNKERKENGVTSAMFKEMNVVYKIGDAKLMTSFLEKNPSCNYNNEFIIPANEFIFGRKAIFGSKGLKITGKKL